AVEQLHPAGLRGVGLLVVGAGGAGQGAGQQQGEAQPGSHDSSSRLVVGGVRGGQSTRAGRRRRGRPGHEASAARYSSRLPWYSASGEKRAATQSRPAAAITPRRCRSANSRAAASTAPSRSSRGTNSPVRPGSSASPAPPASVTTGT